jgi:arylsulfatase A-like enzyme
MRNRAHGYAVEIKRKGLVYSSLKGGFTACLIILREPRYAKSNILPQRLLIMSFKVPFGVILAELERLGQAENTVILFAADNAYYYGELGLNTKFYLHEESIRVPLLVMGPRQPHQVGVTVEPLAANTDLAPTLLDLADVPIPAAMHGRSLLPLLRGEAPANWREAIFCENVAKERRPMCDAIRTQDWKYIAYFETQPLQAELYHLSKDPYEQRNLAVDPAQRRIKQELADQLHSLRVEFSGVPDGFPPWIQSQKENIANWQDYRDAYQRLTRP